VIRQIERRVRRGGLLARIAGVARVIADIADAIVAGIRDVCSRIAVPSACAIT